MKAIVVSSLAAACLILGLSAAIAQPPVEQPTRIRTSAAQPAPAGLDLLRSDRDDKTRQPIRFADGSQLSLPAGGATGRAFRAKLGRLSPQQQTQLQLAGGKMASALYAVLSDPADPANLEALAQGLASTFETYVAVAGEDDYDAALQAVLYMGTRELEQDLLSFASQVRRNLQLSAQLGEAFKNLQDTGANWPPGQRTRTVTWLELDGEGRVREVTQSLTVEQAKSHLEALAMHLETNRNRNELDQWQLQDLYQRYARAISVLSDSMKAQHAALEEIINGLR
jgi:hypothetical protein